MRVATTALSALRPFGRGWTLVFLVALFLTFGVGGGTPGSTPWLIIKFSLLGLLLATLLAELASQLRDRPRRA